MCGLSRQVVFRDSGLSRQVSLYLVYTEHLSVCCMYKVFLDCVVPVLGLEGVDQSVDYGIRHCQDMANIVQRLINDGKAFR